MRPEPPSKESMVQAVLLEQTIERHDFPLRLTIGRAEMGLVEDSAFDALRKGEPTLGWEGDARLAVYVCPMRQTFELVRYEANGTYTSIHRIHFMAMRSVELCGFWIGWLVTHDKRRGHDAIAKQDLADVARKAERDRLLDEQIEAGGDKLKHALRKGGVLVGGGLHHIPNKPGA